MKLRRALPLFAALWVSASYADAAVLRGHLHDGAGGTAAAEPLILVNAGSGEEFFVRTDEQGAFELELPSGDYSIYLVGESRRSLLTQVRLLPEDVQQVDLRRPEPRDAALEAIRMYELGEIEGGVAQTSDLSALINPFPQRQQGRYFGSVYWFHRNDNLDARNFFDPPGEPLPEFKRNQFGFTLGAIFGPSLSLEGTYEGLRIVQGSTLVSHVPSLAQRQGDFSQLGIDIIDPLTGQPFPGNRIPADRFSPASAGLLSVIPQPNQSDPDRNFINADPNITDNNLVNIRVDYRPDETSNLSANYTFNDGGRVEVRPLPNFSRNIESDNQSLSVSYNRSLGTSTVVFGSVRFSRDINLTLSENSGRDGLLASLGIEGVSVTDPVEEGYPNFRVTGYANFGDEGTPSTSTVNQLEFEGSATFGLGNHTLRTGLEVEPSQLNNHRSGASRRGRFSFSGGVSGDGFADFLLGFVDSGSRATGEDRVDLRQTKWEVYVRDDWRLSSTFNIALGIRYNYNPPYRSIGNNVSTFYPLLFEPPLDGGIIIDGSKEADALGFDKAIPGTLIFPDRNDWAPNLGLAWSPMGNNRLVIRASFDIHYRPLERRNFVESLTRNAPFWIVDNVVAESGFPEIVLDSPFDGDLEPGLGVRGIDPYMRTGYTQNWSLSIQNEVARNLTITGTYSGRRGNGMNRTTPTNVPLPGPGQIEERRPNPAFGQMQLISSSGRWDHHELKIEGVRRFSGGFSLRSGFEWTSSTNDDSRGRPNDPRNLRAEKALSNFVSPKRFFLNYIVDLPFGPGHYLSGGGSVWAKWMLAGWRVSGITEIRDGRPYTVFMSGDPDNDGVGGDRPDRLADGRLPAEDRSIDRWFDTTAFAAPEQYVFGNAGANLDLTPGRNNWDISLIKRTPLQDGKLLEFRVALFNAFNKTNFQRPNTQFGTSTFGQIFSSEGGREIEIALKYSF